MPSAGRERRGWSDWPRCMRAGREAEVGGGTLRGAQGALPPPVVVLEVHGRRVQEVGETGAALEDREVRVDAAGEIRGTGAPRPTGAGTRTGASR